MAMYRRAAKIEQMLDGTTGNAASFPGVKNAKWCWRDNEGCYEFCVEQDDGRQLNWNIHSIHGKNLYDFERPDGVIRERMKAQDVKQDLNQHLKDKFGERTSRRAMKKWKELKTILGTSKALEQVSVRVGEEKMRDSLDRVAWLHGLDSEGDMNNRLASLDRQFPDDVLADEIATCLRPRTLEAAVEETAREWDLKLR